MPTVVNGYEGEDYESKCSARGGLDNQFIWTYLRTDNLISNSTTLQVNNVNVLNGGDYECLVSNLAGNESKIFTLNSKLKKFLLMLKYINFAVVLQLLQTYWKTQHQRMSPSQ